MHILILGGTGFLGARTVESALASRSGPKTGDAVDGLSAAVDHQLGHEVTIFTRGKTHGDRFAGRPGLTHLIGDRDPALGPGLDELAAAVHGKGIVFDAVLDISGYLPRHVRASVELLAPHTETYLFISSVSVYADPVAEGVEETGGLIALEDETVEEITPETYGGLKVVCERIVREVAGDSTLVVRPGIIAGPDDFTDRFSYWAWAADRCIGPELLAPGSPRDPTQVIDAADLGAWLIELAERGACAVRREAGTDTFNATGPRGMNIGQVIEASIAAAGSSVTPTWVPLDFLEQHSVRAFADMPLWIPKESGRTGMLTADSSRAYASGLKLRPLADTAASTWAWFARELANRESHAPSTGLAPKRAAEVLAAFKAAATS